jgi:hypothetical protein
MRGLIELMTIFDWITPTVGFIEDFYNDPTPLQTNSWTFFVPYDESLSGGWNAAMIERTLSQNGVKHWGGQITGGRYFVSVPVDQARRAEHLLTGQGVPLDPLSLGAPAPKGEQRLPAHLLTSDITMADVQLVSTVSPLGRLAGRAGRFLLRKLFPTGND